MKPWRWMTAGIMAGLLTAAVVSADDEKPAAPPAPAGFDRPLVVDRYLERKVAALEQKAATLEQKVAALEQALAQLKEQVARVEAAQK